MINENEQSKYNGNSLMNEEPENEQFEVEIVRKSFEDLLKINSSSGKTFPFAVTLFEDSSWMQILFFVIYFPIGCIVALVRFFVLTVSINFVGDGVFSKLALRFLLGIPKFNLLGNVPNMDELQKKCPQKKKFVFLANHTYSIDLGVSNAAIRNFNLCNDVRGFVHPKVYHSSLFSFVRNYSITSKKGENFGEIFQSWGDNSQSPVDGILLAPTGMTCKHSYIAPMHIKYFQHEKVMPILMNIDIKNPFGLNLRCLNVGLGTSLLLSFFSPWHSVQVEFKPVLSNVESQEQVNHLVENFYKTNKTFASGWTTRARRRIDKYRNKNEYIQIPDYSEWIKMQQNVKENKPLVLGIQNYENVVSEQLESQLEKLEAHGNIVVEKIEKDETKPVDVLFTTKLENNKQLDFCKNNVALINPETERDEWIAAGLNIPMKMDLPKSQKDSFNYKEVKINIWLQTLLSHKIINYFGAFLHFVLIERNFIILGNLLLATGVFVQDVLLIFKVLGLVQTAILIFKFAINRPRPVWLDSSVKVKSIVSDLQVDGSFPSGHTSFMVLLFVTAFYGIENTHKYEYGIHSVVIFGIFSCFTAIERVRVGAHYLSDVVCGALFSVLLCALVFGVDELEKTYLEVSSINIEDELKQKVLLTVYTFLGYLALWFSVGLFSKKRTTLEKDYYFNNNLQRLPKEPKRLLRPLDPSKTGSVLAPFFAVIATTFWLQPFLVKLFSDNEWEFTDEIPGYLRFVAAILALLYIVLVVLPLRKISNDRFTILLFVYMSMLFFTGAVCSIFMQRINSLYLK